MIRVDIVHKDDTFVVIDKPPGVAFHREGSEPGLAARVRECLGSGELYPVHRLDTVTSGLMVFGRKREVARELAARIRTRSLEKFYLALAAGKPRKKQGLIAGDMERSRRGTWKLMHSRENPAVTQFVSKSMGNNLRLYLLKPLTGRTHQLRVAMKSLGCPVLGDPLYRGAGFQGIDWDRTYLHAFALCFELGGIHHRFSKPPEAGRLFMSDRFRDAVQEYCPPWAIQWPRTRGFR